MIDCTFSWYSFPSEKQNRDNNQSNGQRTQDSEVTAPPTQPTTVPPTDVQREVEAGRCVAHIGVGGRVNGQQEVVDELQQLQVGRGTEHLLDDLDKRQADVLRDGGQVLVPVLLRDKQLVGCRDLRGMGEGRSEGWSVSPAAAHLQDLAGEQEAMHHFSFEELPDVEDLMRVMHPDEDLQGGEQRFPHSALARTRR